MGWLARKHGLAANSVTAIEVVTADGEFHRVDHTHERDLFFALRGGGGNFGVVTAIEFKLFPMSEVFAGWLIWPWEESGRVLAAWRDWTETTPDEVTSVGRILQFPPIEVIPEPLRGRNLVVVEVAYMGDEASGRELLQPLLELEPEMSTLATMPAAGLVRLHADPEGHTPGDRRRLACSTSLPDEAIASLVARRGPRLRLAVHLGRAAPARRRARPPRVRRRAPPRTSRARSSSSRSACRSRPRWRRRIETHLDVVDDAMAPWKSRQTYFNFAERPVDSDAPLRRLDARPPARDPRALRPLGAVPRQPPHPARRRRLVDAANNTPPVRALAPAAFPVGLATPRHGRLECRG